MKYERLTERTDDGGVKYQLSKTYNHFRVVYPKGNEDSLLIDCIDRLAIRLCEFEDDVEQGKLKKIPDNAVIVEIATYENMELKNYRDIISETIRAETAKQIYDELNRHGTTYVKKWIKQHYNIEVKYD